MSSVVLITGCSAGGIGFSLCEEFAQRGCKVYATARNPVKMDGLSSANIEKLSLDVTNDEDVKRVVQYITEKEGRIDIVVNNAGMMAAGALLDQTMETVQDAFNTNTYSVLRVAKAVVPFMAARKRGLLVNIGSVVGDIAVPWNGLYSATKSAVHMISEILSMECRPFNISIMNVEPGAVQSNISSNQNAKFSLPDGSLYKAFLPNIVQRINASQGSKAMPADQFAKIVVSKALSKSPPLHLTAGGNSTIFTIFKWLPKTWVLGFLWRSYSKKL